MYSPPTDSMIIIDFYRFYLSLKSEPIWSEEGGGVNARGGMLCGEKEREGGRGRDSIYFPKTRFGVTIESDNVLI